MIKTPVPVSRSDQFNLRLPEGMREEIAKAAKASGRSLNSEIVSLIHAGLDSETRVLAAISDLNRSVNGLSKRLAAIESHLLGK